MTTLNTPIEKPKHAQAKVPNMELIQTFWASPSEAFFSQEIVSAVTGRSNKTLECDRWKKSGIPYRKMGGKVLYRKSDVVAFLESHDLVTSTSQYGQERKSCNK